MKMIQLAIALLIWGGVRAGEPINTTAVLKSVILYRTGAELTHLATAVLPAGNVTLAIDRVSDDIDLNSVRVRASSDVTLLGFSFVNDYMGVHPKTSRQQMLEDSLDRLTDAQARIQLTLANIGDLLEVLKKNQDLKGVGDLQKLMEYYKTESGDLLTQQYELNRKHAHLGEEIDRVKAQIAEEETQNVKRAGRLFLNLSVASAGSVEFTLSYITTNAGWAPAYELQATDNLDSVKVLCKANIQQSSGLDWRQVKMVLSTSLPGSWNVAPELQPWYLGFQQKLAPVVAYGLEGKVAGMVRGAQLDDVVVTRVDRKEMHTPTVQVQEQSVSIVYEIAQPLDLPSTGKDQQISLQTLEVPASFTYFAVPKLSEDVYLLADIPDWGKLNLLKGQANIVLNGTYQGVTTIDPSATADTLHLTLGKDSRISLERNTLTDLGSRRSKKYVYEISVRNNKKTGINLSLLDQIPITTNKDLEVVLNDAGNAQVNAEKGELTWRLSLKAGESTKVRFGYTLRYPKDEELLGLRTSDR